MSKQTKEISKFRYEFRGFLYEIKELFIRQTKNVVYDFDLSNINKLRKKWIHRNT